MPVLSNAGRRTTLNLNVRAISLISNNSFEMKVGDTVVLLGLKKAKHLNSKLATIVRKHDGDQWIVVLKDDVLSASVSMERINPCA